MYDVASLREAELCVFLAFRPEVWVSAYDPSSAEQRMSPAYGSRTASCLDNSAKQLNVQSFSKNVCGAAPSNQMTAVARAAKSLAWTVANI